MRDSYVRTMSFMCVSVADACVPSSSSLSRHPSALLTEIPTLRFALLLFFDGSAVPALYSGSSDEPGDASPLSKSDNIRELFLR